MNSKEMLAFLEIIGQLKSTVRKGWELRDVPKPECVASHMYRMAIMTFLLNDDEILNRTRCMKLALVHDLAEAIVGDITPLCGVDIKEKHRREDQAMKSITKLLGDRGLEMYDLYKEYETQCTAEAKFVKDIDRFDMILQAFEYEKRDNKPAYLQEFFDSTAGKFRHPMIKSLCEELVTQRNGFNLNQKEKN